jgi:O-antigen/teichoic acid export membrane protein
MPLARPAAIGLLVAVGAASSRAVALAWGLPWLVAAVLGGLILARQARRISVNDVAAVPRQPWRRTTWEFWSFASARAIAGTAEVTLVWLDVLLVGWLVGPVQAGIYATASRFVTTGTLALQASRIAITPELSRLLSTRRHREAEQLFHGATRAVVAASWPLYIGLACFSHVILRVFGHGFTAGATALSVLAAAMLVDTFTGNIGSVILMAGSSRLNLLNAGTGLVVDVVVDIALIPRYGATGAAIGWACAIVVINAMACIEVRNLMGLRIFESTTNKVAIVAAAWFGVPGVVLAIVAGDSPWALVAWLVIAGVGYLSWWWRRRDDPDVQAMVAAFARRGSASRDSASTVTP